MEIRESQFHCETRRLNKAGYARFRNFLLYGERNLAGETVQVDIFQDVLILDYHQEKLSRYSVEFQPDERHFRRVGNPRLYDHRYLSAQLELWNPGDIEWFVIIRESAPVRRRNAAEVTCIQGILHEGKVNKLGGNGYLQFASDYVILFHKRGNTTGNGNCVNSCDDVIENAYPDQARSKAREPSHHETHTPQTLGLSNQLCPRNVWRSMVAFTHP